MENSTVKELCFSYPGVIAKEQAEPSNIFILSVDGKKFSYFKTSEPEKGRFSIRVSPDRFLELTDQPGVKPARYMHRFHWITIVDVSSFDEEYLQELIHWSYHKALSALPKKIQAEITR